MNKVQGSSYPLEQGPEAYRDLLRLLERKTDTKRPANALYSQIPSSTPGTAMLEAVHRLNVQQSKLALYKDYYHFSLTVYEKQPGGGPDYISSTDSTLHEKISRYSKAMADYKAFVECECTMHALRKTSTESVPQPFTNRVLGLEWQDRTLFETAQRLVGFEKYSEQLVQEGKDDDDIVVLREKLWTPVEVREQHVAKEICPGGLVDSVTPYTTRGEKLRQEVTTQWAFIGKLGMALFGGFILIAPMLIMRLHSDLLTVVLTTSVFVAVVSILLATIMIDAAPKDILGAAAAYAAVLVVFVGQEANPEASSLSNGQIAGVTVGTIAGVTLIGVGLSVTWWIRTSR